MIIQTTKKELKQTIQKIVEDTWYNRRSLDPVKEQAEQIFDALCKMQIDLFLPDDFDRNENWIE